MHLKNHLIDELFPGQTAAATRLIMADDLYAFAVASGNFNPQHLEGDDGQASPPPAQGMFVAALISGVLGTTLPGPGTTLLKQALTFVDRAFAGDEVVCHVLVDAVDPQVGTVDMTTTVTRPRDGAVILHGQLLVRAPTHRFDRDGLSAPGLIVQRHRHFAALVERAAGLPPLTVAVVSPTEPAALEGALLARDRGLMVPLLVGDQDAIARAAAELGPNALRGAEVVAASDADAAATTACQLVREGRAGAVMKGHLHTDALLRPILDRDHGLRAGRRLTHVFVMDVPGLAEPLLVSDAAINIAPDLATKVDIVQNAIDLARALGLDPRAGILSAVETVTPTIPSSLDAALLSKMAERGQITGGAVDGPLAMDNAVDLGAARVKGLRGQVAGRANILVAPGIDAANMLAKELTFIAHAEAAGIVLGARVPIILTSRADGAMSRLASVAVAALMSAPAPIRVA